MKTIELFEEAMCCSTGVCGPSVNKELIQTTMIQQYINKIDGYRIIRRNLAQNPNAFVRDETIANLLKTEGMTCLPITMIDGEVVKTGVYPSFEEFSDYLKLDLSTAQIH